MPNSQDSSDAALEAFRKEQRRRALMGVEQLRGVISVERSRLSQARRALRGALHGLIPPRQSELRRERSRLTGQSVGCNPRDERRMKVSRLLRGRMAGIDAPWGGGFDEG